MNDAKRNKIITFRVTDEEYTQIKDAALTQNRDPNDWCRHAALSSSHFKLTVNEDVFYTELALLRFPLCSNVRRQPARTTLRLRSESFTTFPASGCAVRAPSRL